jgi:adenine-specific DNA-methyltransferase
MESINDYMPLSNDWNNERLQTLKQLYPDWFTSEGSLNIDEVKKAVNPDSVNETERYEFRWFGKSQAKRNAFTPSDATLVYDEDRSVNPESSENLIIEGENLEVLKLLSGSYREKVKCIYIDPPYNTGKDFVYSDNFTQDKKGYWADTEVTENGVKIDTNTETDGRYHSNWLNMMYSRLLIARQLLREDGVIFISIDDNEVHHLRKLCDEVFGEDNFIAEMVWKRRATAPNDRIIGKNHEYILCYSKQIEELKLVLLPRSAELNEAYKNPDNDPRGPWRASDLSANGKGGRIVESCIFPILNPKNGNEYYPPENKCWLYNEEKVLSLLNESRIDFRENSGNPFLKRFLSEVRDGMTLPTILDNVGFSQDSAKQIKDLFNNDVFEFPKPYTLLMTLFSISLEKNDVILDFFGGSGTTGQAVMELNKQDGGKRKSILVQIPEATGEKSEAYKAGYKKISDITIERNKRVIAKIEKELAEKEKKKEGELALEKVLEPSSTNLGFKVFKLQKSNFPRVDFAPNPEFNETENLELLKKYISDKESQLVSAFNKEELLTEILLKNNFTLNYTVAPQEQFIKNEILFVTDGEKETLICLDVNIATETVSHFKAHTGTKFICLERALDTTTKYNLKHYLGDKFNAF